MAELPRPNVHIEQEIVNDTPTVVTPTLVPCIIGPCYQIVEALEADGSLNASALVSTSAVLRSSVAVGDPLAASGLKLKISVDGAPGQTINLPVTIGTPLSHTIMENSINTQLTGASAEFVDEKLVITATSKGVSSRLKVETIADDAYTELNLTDGDEVTGKSSYTGTDYDILYGNLPSPLTDADNLAIDGDDVSVYRYFNNTLYPLSVDSATNHTSRTGASSSVANSGITRLTRPALGHDRTDVVGIKVSGSKTNTLVHRGKEAMITIPLAHDSANTGTVQWPDVTGSNYIQIKAIGLQNWEADQDGGAVGNYVGVDGNLVKVTFTDNAGLGAGLANVVWTSGTKTLDIQRKDDTVTFTALQTALTSITGLDTSLDLDITLAFDSSLAALPYLHSDGLDDGGGTSTPFYLSGGEDPVDFSSDHAVGRAGLTGAVHAGGLTGTQLGIVGEVVTVTLNGGEPIEVTIDAGTAVNTLFDNVTGLDAGSDTIWVTDEDAADDGVAGSSYNALRLQVGAALGESGPDCTLEVSCSTAAAEALFGGFKSKTEAAATGFGMGGAGTWDTLKRRAVLLTGSGNDFNTLARVEREEALVPGSLDITFGSVVMPALVLCDVTLAGLNGLGGPLLLKMSHSADGVVRDIDLPDSLNFTGAVTLAELVTELQAAITTEGNLTALVGVCELNGRLAFYDLTATVGAVVTLVFTGTNATLHTALNWASGDRVGTSVTTTCRIKDSGTDYALRMVSVGNAFSDAYYPTTFDPTSESELTATCLDFTAGDVDYSVGSVTVTFAGDPAGNDGVADAAADRYPPVLRINGAANVSTSTASITYSRVWACCTQAASPSYTGRVFMGGAVKALTTDMVYNNGVVLGRLVAIDDFIIGSKTFTGAKLTLSEYSVDNQQVLSDWYIVAEDLPDSVNRAALAPEMVVDATASRLRLKGALNRGKDGLPVSGNAPLYVAYKALRLDVSAADADPSLLVFNTIDEVESTIGPVSTENPLAWGLSAAFLNRTNISISALGIDEVTADAPYGTVAAYAGALDFLQKKSVYALAPMTLDPEVTKLFSLHVTDMSAADKERVALCCDPLLTEKNPTLVISGTMQITDIGGGKYNLQFTDNTLNISTAINGLKNANGDAISGGIGTDYGPDDGIYLDRSGDALRWLVTKLVATDTVQIDTNDVYLPGSGPGTGGNDDGYFSEDATELSDFLAVGEVSSILIRQAAMTKLTPAGRLEIVEQMAELTGGAAGFQNRRLVYMQPETVGMQEGGTEVAVPGFYLCAAEAARTGQFSPQQSHSNMPLVGFTRPVGSSDLFSEKEMATAASGGVWWQIQDVPQGAVFPRHELTTDTSSVKTQQYAITKAIDFYTMTIRAQIKRKVGRNNITDGLLNELGIILQATASRMSGNGKALARASITKIGRAPGRVDGVYAESAVTPWYSLNAMVVRVIA